MSLRRRHRVLDDDHQPRFFTGRPPTMRNVGRSHEGVTHRDCSRLDAICLTPRPHTRRKEHELLLVQVLMDGKTDARRETSDDDLETRVIRRVDVGESPLTSPARVVARLALHAVLRPQRRFFQRLLNPPCVHSNPAHQTMERQAHETSKSALHSALYCAKTDCLL